MSASGHKQLGRAAAAAAARRRPTGKHQATQRAIEFEASPATVAALEEEQRRLQQRPAAPEPAAVREPAAAPTPPAPAVAAAATPTPAALAALASPPLDVSVAAVPTPQPLVPTPRPSAAGAAPPRATPPSSLETPSSADLAALAVPAAAESDADAAAPAAKPKKPRTARSTCAATSSGCRRCELLMCKRSVALPVARRSGPRVRGPTLRLRVPAFGTDTRAVNELDVVMAAVTEAIAAYRCVPRGAPVRARAAVLNAQADRATVVGPSRCQDGAPGRAAARAGHV